MIDFDETNDPLPLANKLILNGGQALPEEVLFIARALLLAHVKVDMLYGAIERGPKGPEKLCDVLNAATEWRRRIGEGALPVWDRNLIEAVDAAWRNDVTGT